MGELYKNATFVFVYGIAQLWLFFVNFLKFRKSLLISVYSDLAWSNISINIFTVHILHRINISRFILLLTEHLGSVDNTFSTELLFRSFEQFNPLFSALLGSVKSVYPAIGVLGRSEKQIFSQSIWSGNWLLGYQCDYHYWMFILVSTDWWNRFSFSENGHNWTSVKILSHFLSGCGV